MPTTPAVPPPPGHHPPRHARGAARGRRRPRRAHGRGDRRLAAGARRAAPRDRPAVGRASARRTSAPSSPSTPAPGTCTATGCRRSPPAGSPRSPRSGRLVRHRGTVDDARHAPTASRSPSAAARLAGRRRGQLHRPGRRPVARPAAHPARPHRPGRAPARPGLGIDTADDGRVLGVLPATMPFFALGSLRRGNLWETTAMPEIREQAYDVAHVGDPLAARRDPAPADRRLRPRSDHRQAAPPRRTTTRWAGCCASRTASRRDCAGATALDPGFALAHTALALLGHEWGAAGSWRASLRAAHEAAADRHLDDREISLLDAVTTRLRADEATGAAALLRHVRLFPRDALAVSVAVPTVAFGGLTSGRQTAALVEGLGKTYGDDWWYAGQLAFVRQDQERWERGGGARVVRPLGGAGVRPRRARPRARLLRDRPARRRARLARRVDPHLRSRGQPPLALLLARRAARAPPGRPRRRTPPLRPRARPARGHRFPRARRQRCAAVALPDGGHPVGDDGRPVAAARRRPTAG